MDEQLRAISEAHLVCHQIPHVRSSKTGITLLDAHLLIDPLLNILQLCLDPLQSEGIGTLTL